MNASCNSFVVGRSVGDANGTLQKKKTRLIDSLNCLQQDIGDTSYATAPTSAITQYGYDTASNLTAKLDVAGRCSVTTYDTLNRAATVKHIASATAATCIPTTTATAAETISYTYDSTTATVGGAGGKGRLGQLTDGTGSTAYTYDKSRRT